MNRFKIHGRELLLGDLAEITRLGPPVEPFSLLVATAPDSPTSEETSLIEALAVPGCRAMCFSGPGAERLHDTADGIVEERGLLDIVTTWHAHEDATEVVSYFLELAGGGASWLLACVGHEPNMARALLVSGGEPRQG